MLPEAGLSYYGRGYVARELEYFWSMHDMFITLSKYTVTVASLWLPSPGPRLMLTNRRRIRRTRRAEPAEPAEPEEPHKSPGLRTVIIVSRLGGYAVPTLLFAKTSSHFEIPRTCPWDPPPCIVLAA